jgi:hypothetical protein
MGTFPQHSTLQEIAHKQAHQRCHPDTLPTCPDQAVPITLIQQGAMILTMVAGFDFGSLSITCCTS